MLEKGQTQNANAYLREVERNADVQFFWFDPEGKELFGTSMVPHRVRQLAGRVAGTGQPEFLPTETATYGAQVASASDGEVYELLRTVLPPWLRAPARE